MDNDECKQNLFFPEEMLEEMAAEAARQGCSLSKIVQKAWAVARKEMTALPAINGPSRKK